MKGIVLAGGAGTRLHPVTRGISKQLLPVYDKPMIYYPLSVLMLAGIRDILVVTTPEEQPMFVRLLGDGGRFGVNLSYAVQPRPEGLAQAFIIGEKFLGGEPAAMILGDNIFYGANLSKLVQDAARLTEGAKIFGYYMRDVSRFGVLELDGEGRVLSIEEKPERPKSNYAATGLYFYDGEASEIAKSLKPSRRGELEITDLNLEYLKRDRLAAGLLGRGYVWMDTGTADSLLEAGNFVAALENRQGMKIACLEEIAFRQGWLTRDELLKQGAELKNCYGEYLCRVAQEAQSVHV